ncbi:MAG: hypothetical protein AAGG08_20900, partial [Actinomycetota bacterium]
MRATTRQLAELIGPDATAPDLNDVSGETGTLLVRDGSGVAGAGAAHRVDADRAVEFLADIHHDSTVADASPLAIGTIPFRPGDASE